MTARAERGAEAPAGEIRRSGVEPPRGEGLPVEVLWTWALFGAVGLAVLVTYIRVPAAELYGTSVEGLAGGFGRTLVYLNFPTALAALAVLGIVADRAGSRRIGIAALVAAGLCLVVGLPGVVDEDDLDAKWANAVPALGVGLAVLLTILAARRHGVAAARPRIPGDRLRIGLAAVLGVISIPWIFSELGFYVSDAPVLGSIFMGDEIVPEPDHPEIRAVHLGHHHGTDGVLFALAALALTRPLARMRSRPLRLATTAWVSLMLVYGLANGIQDFWLEQVVKRGTTSAELPSFLRPELTPAWIALLAAAVVVYALLTRPTTGMDRR